MDSEYREVEFRHPDPEGHPVPRQAARTDTVTGDKTELVILVTPYILREGDDMSRWAAATPTR